MITPSNQPYTAQADAMLDGAAQATTRAIEGAERAAHSSFGAMAGGVEGLRQRAGPALHDLAAGAEDLARHSAAAVRERALRARDVSTDYVRDHPLQAVLIAAAGGAAMVLLLRLLSRSDRPRNGMYR